MAEFFTRNKKKGKKKREAVTQKMVIPEKNYKENNVKGVRVDDVCDVCAIMVRPLIEWEYVL